MDAIADCAEIAGEIAADVQAILEDDYDDVEAGRMGRETEYADYSYYEEKGVSTAEWQSRWQDFERSLKTEARFFSKSASELLETVFAGIADLQSRDGRPLIRLAGPGTDLPALYRARVFQARDRLEEALCRPDSLLGSPPASFAAAGRMNANGISVFYGASEPSVAIAEVRPPVGSYAVVARFMIVRPLHLLDLTALSMTRMPGSVFDSDYAKRLERAFFLRSLSERMAMAHGINANVVHCGGNWLVRAKWQAKP